MCRLSYVFALVFGICLFQVQYGSCARILATVCTPSFSHQVAFREIWKELAKRGHELVLITTDPMKEDIENLRQIDASSSYSYVKSTQFDTMVANKSFENPMKLVKHILNAIVEVNRHQLQLPEVKQLIENKTEKFDLIMTELMFPVHLGFVERFNVPIIGLVSLDATFALHNQMGNDAHPILYPELIMIPTAYPLSLWYRVVSSVSQLLTHAYISYVVRPEVTKLIKEIFGENSRSVEELFAEVDMLFLNSNPIFHHIRALTPNTISFGGGSHVESVPVPVPRDLLKFLDNAPNGVVYFSLGSNVKSNLLNGDMQQVFVETFAELPYKILWKFEGELSSNKSDNVMISKWLPQNEVLKHPNVKVFITQCGLQSMEEAIMNHVPMVGIPFFADQPANGEVLQRKGLGIRLNYETLTKDIFKESLVDVMTNPKYRENVVEVADLLKDVEMTGIERVIWWTEYVIRNKGAKAFRNPIFNVPLYQYYFLDVIALVVTVVIISLLISRRIFSYFFNRICRRKSKIN